MSKARLREATVVSLKYGSPVRWSDAVKVANGSREQDQVPLIVHEINNMICSLRLHANNLSVEPQLRGAADDILSASNQIEMLVMRLASLAGKPSQDESAGATLGGQVL